MPHFRRVFPAHSISFDSSRHLTAESDTPRVDACVSFSWLEMWMFPLYVLNLKVFLVKFMYALLNSTEALSFWICLVVDFIWYIFIVYVYCMVYGLTKVNHSIGKLDSSESPETLTIKVFKFAPTLIFCDDVVQLQHHNLNWSLINHSDIFHNFRLSSINMQLECS